MILGRVFFAFLDIDSPQFDAVPVVTALPTDLCFDR